MHKNSAVRGFVSLFEDWCRKCSKFGVNYQQSHNATALIIRNTNLDVNGKLVVYY